LVIDLDPQTNASIMVAGPEKWNAMREAERTLDFFFESYIIQQKAKPFSRWLRSKSATSRASRMWRSAPRRRSSALSSAT
jgi:hypothetical protein